MPSVLMYATEICPYCRRARRLFQRKGVGFEEILIDDDPAQYRAMVARSGRHTVPQIFIDDRHIGGYDDLAALDREGGLDPLLFGEPG